MWEIGLGAHVYKGIPQHVELGRQNPSQYNIQLLQRLNPLCAHNHLSDTNTDQWLNSLSITEQLGKAKEEADRDCTTALADCKQLPSNLFWGAIYTLRVLGNLRDLS